MKTTKVFKKNLKAFVNKNIRLIINYGGSSSSKTISILQLLLLYVIKNPNKRVAILSENTPKLKRTVLKDFQKVVLPQDDLEYLNEKNFNKTELIYTFKNGSEIMFFSADSTSKIIGMRMDVLYVDEINYIKKSIFDQLSIRTAHKIICSYNPSSKFYIMDEFDRKDVKVIHSTYKDNQFVSKVIIKELQLKAKRDKNFKRVYLDGKIGVAEGLIFNEDINYSIVKKIPNKKVKRVVYGCDFGFKDPTTLVELNIFEDDTIYIKEILYKVRLTPKKIVAEFNRLNKRHNIGKNKIYADSARPEIIEEIYNNKYNIHSVKKTSIIYGINKMMDHFMYIDIDSINLINELYNYVWEKDKNEEEIDKPIDNYNHLLDAIRYAETDIKKRGKMGVTLL